MRNLECLSFDLFICQVSRYLLVDKFVEFVHTKSIWYKMARAFDLSHTDTKIKSHMQNRKQQVQSSSISGIKGGESSSQFRWFTIAKIEL